MNEFDKLVAVVTGGAAGLGAAIAERLSSAGAKVAIIDLVDSVAVQGLHSIKADITNDDDVRLAINEVARRHGGIDILVNNAGIGAQGNVEANSDAEWHHVYDVNVVGIVRVTRAALPHLRTSSSGTIINIASVAATTGLVERALYSATKGAVVALTRAMAADHIRDGIRVNCVNPGTADTAWVERIVQASADPATTRSALVSRQPHGRLVDPSEIADAVAYLASPRSKSTNGVALAVDGGLTALRTTSP